VDKKEIVLKKSALYWTIGVIIGVVFLGYVIYSTNAFIGMMGDTAVEGDVVEFDLYAMSQCPYGVQVEDSLPDVIEVLGDSVKIDIDFIASEREGVFQSLHGQQEIDGDIIQLCAKEYYPDEYVDFIFCQNKDMKDLKGTVDSCAEENGMDAEKIMDCFDNEGEELLRVSISKSNQANARGSPTMYINGQPYQGGRDATSLIRALCSYMDSNPACDDIPDCTADTDCTAESDKVGKCENSECVYVEDEEVEFIVLNDKECGSCDTTQIVAVSAGYFKNLDMREVDVNDAEGQELVESLGITLLPAYIFDGNVVNTDTWQSVPDLRGAFEMVGDAFKLRDSVTGASYYVSEDARNSFYESIGVTKGDNRPQIDFFVMSYCPYGNVAEEAIEPVYQALKNSADFNPHFVIYSNYNGGGPDYCLDDESKYCSMHGVQELNQDIREFCVAKHMGMDEWFEFVLEMNDKCNYQNADSCWEGVASDLGLDTTVISDCEENEAMDILAAELELGNSLGVSGSPTVFIDGDKFNGDRSAEGYMQGLCNSFDTAPEECADVDLSDVEVESVPAGSCG